MDHPSRSRILVDDREPVEGLLPFFDSFQDLDVSVERLPVGDFLADEQLVFERKTLNDLANSIIDGRLFSQMSKMLASDYQPVLILEGTSKDLADRKINRETIQGALINVSLIHGIPVLRSMNQQETCNLIVYCIRQLKAIKSGEVLRHGYRPKGKVKRQQMILQGLPGIGKKRAKQLLEKFESVENVMTASYEDLQSIEGIGKKTADEIRYVLSEARAPYGTADNLLPDI